MFRPKDAGAGVADVEAEAEAAAPEARPLKPVLLLQRWPIESMSLGLSATSSFSLATFDSFLLTYSCDVLSMRYADSDGVDD